MRPRLSSAPTRRFAVARAVPVLFALAAIAGPADAAGSPPKPPNRQAASRLAAATFEVKRATSAVRVDGVLDEPAWVHATRIPLPYEYQPGDNVPPPVKTDCLVTYDEHTLYVGFRAYDPNPSDIRSHLMARDDINTFVEDDHVGILIDAFNDERRAFQFRVNPAGVQADAINSEIDQSEDWSWDAIWRSAARIDEHGYTVEIAIPFNQIRFPAAVGGLTWGFEAFRSYPRSVRHRIASHPTDRNLSCGFCQMNKLTGIVGITPGHNIEIDPTMTVHRSDTREDVSSGPVVRGPISAQPGATVRWSVTPSAIVNATVNPDFSQVEADVAQLDVNTRFALFYPEKRPFFLEGSDFFSTPEQVVFTRTVADPQGGLKLTSKSGPNAVGVFVTRDRINNLILPSNQASDLATIDEPVTGAVLRFRRDVGTGSTIGLLYAGREGDGYHNRLVGPDAFVRLSSTDTGRAQFAYAATAYPRSFVAGRSTAAATAAGADAYAEYQHFARFWTWDVTYNDRAPGFRADSGFIPRVDLRALTGMVQRRFWGSADRAFTTIDVGLDASTTRDHAGTLTDQSVGPFVQYTGPQQSLFYITVTRDKERFAGVTYDLTRAKVNFTLKPGAQTSIGLTGQAGDAIDYVNGRPARILALGPTLEYKVGAPLNLQFSDNLERLTVAPGRLYTANLGQARIVYHFNTRTFVRAIVQFTNIDRDADLFLAPTPSRARTLFSQYLFSYELNPQTVLLVGYSDSYQGLSAVPFAQTGRTFFVKMGYAWLL